MYIIYFKIKDIPIDERPRERLIKVGVENLTNKELISIILKTGLKNKNVNDISLELLNNYSMNELKNISIYDLIKISGIGKTKAIELISAMELGKRVFLSKDEKNEKLDTPEKIWNDIRYYLDGKKQEYFYCYYFNNKQELLERKLLFLGTINNSVTHIREIFKEAYKLSASSIVCIHNHPSNDVKPSKEDIEFTNVLIKTGNLQKIPIIDHIIVGDSNFYSFYEHNIIEDKNNL